MTNLSRSRSRLSRVINASLGLTMQAVDRRALDPTSAAIGPVSCIHARLMLKHRQVAVALLTVARPKQRQIMGRLEIKGGLAE